MMQVFVPAGLCTQHAPVGVGVGCANAGAITSAPNVIPPSHAVHLHADAMNELIMWNMSVNLLSFVARVLRVAIMRINAVSRRRYTPATGAIIQRHCWTCKVLVSSGSVW
jgi:hypothetical protein